MISTGGTSITVILIIQVGTEQQAKEKHSSIIKHITSLILAVIKAVLRMKFLILIQYTTSLENFSHTKSLNDMTHRNNIIGLIRTTTT